MAQQIMTITFLFHSFHPPFPSIFLHFSAWLCFSLQLFCSPLIYEKVSWFSHFLQLLFLFLWKKARKKILFFLYKVRKLLLKRRRLKNLCELNKISLKTFAYPSLFFLTRIIAEFFVFSLKEMFFCSLFLLL